MATVSSRTINTQVSGPIRQATPSESELQAHALPLVRTVPATVHWALLRPGTLHTLSSSFYPLHHPLRWEWLWSLFYRRGKWGSESWCNLTRVMMLARGEGKLHLWGLAPKPALSGPTLLSQHRSLCCQHREPPEPPVRVPTRPWHQHSYSQPGRPTSENAQVHICISTEIVTRTNRP